MEMHKIAPILALLILTAGMISACGRDAMPEAGTAVAAHAGGEQVTGPIVGTLEFTGSELQFEPQAVQVDQLGRYAVTFTNAGHTDHDFVAGDLRLVARPGQTVSGEVYVPLEGLDFVCSFPGHAAGGMQGRITVRTATNE